MTDLTLRQMTIRYMADAGIPMSTANIARIQKMLSAEANRGSGDDGGDSGNTSRMDKLSGTTSAPKRPQGAQDQSKSAGPARQPSPNQAEDDSLARMIRGDGFDQFRTHEADTGQAGPEPAPAAQPTDASGGSGRPPAGVDTGDAGAKGGGFFNSGLAAALGIPAAGAIAYGALAGARPRTVGSADLGITPPSGRPPDAPPPKMTGADLNNPNPTSAESQKRLSYQPSRTEVIQGGDRSGPDPLSLTDLRPEEAPAPVPKQVTHQPVASADGSIPLASEFGGTYDNYAETEKQVQAEMDQRERDKAAQLQKQKEQQAVTEAHADEMNPKKVQSDLRGDAVKLSVDMENDVGIDLEKFGHDPERIKAMLNSLNPQQLNGVLDVLKRHGHAVGDAGEAAKAILYAMRGLKGAVK